MKSHSFGSLRALCSILLLLLTLGGCRGKAPIVPPESAQPPGSSGNEAEPDSPVVSGQPADSLLLSSRNTCILFEAGNTMAAELAASLGKELAGAAGGTVWRSYPSGSPEQIADFNYVITVGIISGMPETEMTGLRRLDYAIQQNGKYISLLGYSFDTLYLAKSRFLQSLSFSDDALLLSSSAFGTVVSAVPYSIEHLTMGGAEICSYTIVSAAENTVRAQELQALIADYSGYVLPIATDQAPATERELVVGRTNRNPEDLLSPGSCRIYRNEKRLVMAFDHTNVGWSRLLGNVQTHFIQTQKGGSLDMEALCFSTNADNAVKMMTYNVLNVWASNGSAGSRDDVTAALIREQDLDFVCLQEFDVWYRNSPNGLNDLLDGDYAEVCVDGVNPNDIWNPIFYKADTWEVEASGCLKMLDHVACIEYNNYVGTSDGVTRFRSLVWAVMVNRNDGSRYLVGNLHYSALSGTDAPNAVHNVHDHSQESDLCIRTIQELVRQYNCPALIGGDYNSTVGSEKGGAYRMLQNGFSDTYALAAFRNMDEQKYASQIDHIFTTSQDLNVLGYYVLDTEQLRSNSDHLPVMIHFQLNQQS